MSNLPVVELMGGLGNQIFQLAFGLSRYGDSEFACTSTYGQPKRNIYGSIELSEFVLPSNVVIVSENESKLKSKLVHFVLILSIKKFKSQKVYLLVKQLGIFVAETIFSLQSRKVTKFVTSNNVGFGELNRKKIRSDERVVGYFQSHAYLEENSLRKLRELQLAQSNPVLDEFRELANIEKPVVLHVRLGDYLNEPGIGLLPISYYRNAVDRIRRDLPNSRIWVFSNDLDQAKNLLSSLTLDGFRFVEDDWRSSALTLEIMRLGRAFILANSTFSYWAAVLNHSNSDLVIAPEPWFLGQPSPHALIPTYWITVSSV